VKAWPAPPEQQRGQAFTSHGRQGQRVSAWCC